MGQYHKIASLDSMEYVTPHKLGLGLKQVEHTMTVASLADVMYMLLTASPNRGGGDLDVDEELEAEFKTFGRWCGQRVVVLGDYTEDGDITGFAGAGELYGNLSDIGIDITDRIIPAFQLAFGVKIDTDKDGWRERKLNPAEWGWLFPDLRE